MSERERADSSHSRGDSRSNRPIHDELVCIVQVAHAAEYGSMHRQVRQPDEMQSSPLLSTLPDLYLIPARHTVPDIKVEKSPPRLSPYLP